MQTAFYRSDAEFEIRKAEQPTRTRWSDRKRRGRGHTHTLRIVNVFNGIIMHNPGGPASLFGWPGARARLPST